MKGKYFIKQAERQLSDNESEDSIFSSESENESENIPDKVNSIITIRNENNYKFKEDSINNITYFLTSQKLPLQKDVYLEWNIIFIIKKISLKIL